MRFALNWAVSIVAMIPLIGLNMHLMVVCLMDKMICFILMMAGMTVLMDQMRNYVMLLLTFGLAKIRSNPLEGTGYVMVLLIASMVPMSRIAQNAMEMPGNAQIHYNASKKNKNVMDLPIAKTNRMKWTAEEVAKMKPGNVSTRANASVNLCSVMAIKTARTTLMNLIAQFVEMMRTGAWMDPNVFQNGGCLTELQIVMMNQMRKVDNMPITCQVGIH